VLPPRLYVTQDQASKEVNVDINDHKPRHPMRTDDFRIEMLRRHLTQVTSIMERRNLLLAHITTSVVLTGVLVGFALFHPMFVDGLTRSL
jgi:hypothetical protein